MSNIVQTIILSLMTVGLVISGILLWKRRKETGDYSRNISSVLGQKAQWSVVLFWNRNIPLFLYWYKWPFSSIRWR